MTQKKRVIVGKVNCFRCETLADVRQGKIGFLYTHCKICGDNFSRSADFQQKIWSSTEFTVEEDALNLADKPHSITLKKYIFEKTTPKPKAKDQIQGAPESTEQQSDPAKHKPEDVTRISEHNNVESSAIIKNNVLIYKEEGKEGTEATECDEVGKSSAGRLALGVGAVICSGFFLLRWLV